MLGDRQKLYDDAKAFFELDGNAVMKLSRRAAIDVCRGAAGKGAPPREIPEMLGGFEVRARQWTSFVGAAHRARGTGYS